MRWVFQRQAMAVAGLAGLVVALGGCAGAGGDVAPAPGRINHVVFFKLTDPGQADKLIADSLQLGAIPGVTACYAGEHIETGRATVTSDYDVGFFVAFDSEADYAGYVAHPDHIALVEKWRPQLESLRTYDILDVRTGD